MVQLAQWFNHPTASLIYEYVLADPTVSALCVSTLSSVIFIPAIITHALPMSVYEILFSLTSLLVFWCAYRCYACCTNAGYANPQITYPFCGISLKDLGLALAPTAVNLTLVNLIYLGVIAYSSPGGYWQSMTNWWRLTSTKCYLLNKAPTIVDADLRLATSISQFL